MNRNEEALPFVSLGRHLRALRVRAQESLAEASGAVEIDLAQLASFENGGKKPSQDILLLLISHFAAKENEALSLWQMAGYGLLTPDGLDQDPALFTDSADVIANQNGVTLNFAHFSSDNSELKPVAKLGMSRAHAKKLAEAINETLEKTEKPSDNKPRN